MHNLFFGTSKFSFDKYIMAIYLSLGKYKVCYFHTPALVKAQISLLDIHTIAFSACMFSMVAIQYPHTFGATVVYWINQTPCKSGITFDH